MTVHDTSTLPDLDAGHDVDDAPALAFGRQDAAAFLEAVFGRVEGFAVLAFGHGGRWSADRGTGEFRYRFAEWSDRHSYRWPAERDRLLGDVAQELAAGPVDVYVCPMLRTDDGGRSTPGAGGQVAWVDLDGATLPDSYRDAGVWVVDSGTPGHMHAYAPLPERRDAEGVQAVSKALATALGGDAKWPHSSVLRLPGTWNFKHDPPTPVRWRAGPYPRPVAPALLASLDATPDPRPATQTIRIDAAAVRLPDVMPTAVRVALGRTTGDRSADVHNLVGVCFRAGLADEQVLAVARIYAPARSKYGDRLDAEIGRSLEKIKAESSTVQPAVPFIPTAAAGVSQGAAVAEGPTPLVWADFWQRAAERPAVSYIARPVIATGEQVTIFAATKVGKSLLALEIAAAVTTGREVLGEQAERRRVLYVDQENAETDLAERLSSLGYGPADDLTGFSYYLLQNWPPLDTPAGGGALLTAVQEFGADLLVIDTQSKVIEGDEDKSATMAAFYRNTILPMKRAGVATLVLDHTGHNGTRQRGTSAKTADFDHVWKLARRDEVAARADRNELKLTRTHNRSRSSDPDELYLRREADPLRHIVEPIEPTAEPDDKPPFRPTGLMEKVSRQLEALPSGMPGSGLERAVGGKRDYVRLAIDRLITEGYISVSKEGASKIHRSVRAFREDPAEPATDGPFRMAARPW